MARDAHPDLEFALALADAADAVTLRWFRTTDLPVEAKPDDTPVSVADRESERVIRSMIEAEHPTHAVLGEEYGVTGQSDWRWVIDPIDGTKNYIRGVPVYATLIALQHDEVGEVGVVSAPALGMRWWGVRGVGAWRDGSPIHVSDIATIDAAFLSSDSYTTFTAHDPSRADGFATLVDRCDRTRGFGDFWSHMLVAEGAIDIAVEPEVALWDLAASAVIVTAAGGRFTDLAGVDGPNGGSVVATNGLLHDAVLATLNP
jgi:histidinol-phosphatase